MIKNYSQIIKKNLDNSITNAASISDLFAKSPGKDFKRKRKLPFEEVIRFIIGIGGNCLNKELLDHFNYSENTPTVSAFVQQRNKLLPEALAFVFHDFTNQFSNWKTHHGYRLLAVDGSTLQIANNQKDTTTFVEKIGTKGLNFLHLNVLYDLENRLYLDSITQTIHSKNEFGALTSMIDRSSIKEPAILIGDRGYESYNILAHLQHKGWSYLIRVKKPTGGNGILRKLELPNNKEFSKKISIRLTRRQTKATNNQPLLYRFLASHSTFDFLEQKSKEYYELGFRVVCIQLEDGKFQYFITNLNPTEFTRKDIEILYKKRWGVETSFRELKHTLALNSFHCKKVDECQQEIYARMIMYNFCEMITLNVVINKIDRKHTYQANFTMAIHICKQLFKNYASAHPPNVEALISRFILPIRDGRKHLRNIKFRHFVSFNYRVA